MKIKKLILYFTIMTSIVCLTLGGILYFFTIEKNKTSNRIISIYKSNSAKLITDKVYEDLLMGNKLEANRKLNLLKESRIISEYEFISGKMPPARKFEFCEPVYFDRISQNASLGNLCLSFTENFRRENLISLSGISLIVFILVIVVIFLLFFMFNFISRLNEELFFGTSQILNSNEEFIFENIFWEPILAEIKKLVFINRENEQKLITQNIEKEKFELASQVAHDIRSPLAALENLHLNQNISANESLIALSAIKRLKGIANSLLEKGRDAISNQVTCTEIHKIIKSTIDVKKIESSYENFKLELLQRDVLVLLDEIKLESILSNILNNAIEASPEKSEIIIRTEIFEDNCIISICDNGKGISPEILTKLGEGKLTFDKKDGNGIGIYSSIQAIESWGGKLTIKSFLNKGTTVKISLPIHKITIDNTIVLLDNDELVRIIWKSKAKKAGINFLSFKSSDEIYKSLNGLPLNTVFYIDSELDNEKGEDVAMVLFEKGFLNLNMCSGYAEEKFNHIPFIKKVIGKNPPF